MSRLVSVVVLASLLLVGCGGADDTGVSDTTSTSSANDAAGTPPGTPLGTPVAPASTSPAAAPDGESCPYLPLEAVAAALGEAMELSAAGPTACLFDAVAEDSPASTSVNLTQLQVDPRQYAADTRDLCEGPATEAEGGDQAFACVTFVGPQGYYFEGATSVLVEVGTADETEESAITAEVALLASITLG